MIIKVKKFRKIRQRKRIVISKRNSSNNNKMRMQINRLKTMLIFWNYNSILFYLILFLI
jgi:hypothetical protein